MLAAYLFTATVGAVTALNIPDILMRPNVYFGTRTAEPSPVMTGLAWANAIDASEVLRHSCRHEDSLKDWGWTFHDGRTYGYQHIRDEQNNMNLTMEWRRTEGSPSECRPWVLSVSGTAAESRRRSSKAIKSALSFFFYMSAADAHIQAKEFNDDGYVITGKRNGVTWKASIVGNHSNVYLKNISSHNSPLLGLTESHCKLLGGSDCSSSASSKAVLSHMLPVDQLWDVDNLLRRAMTYSGRKTQEGRYNAHQKRNNLVKELRKTAPADADDLYQKTERVLQSAMIPTLPTITPKSGSSNVDNFAVVQFVVSMPFSFEIVYEPGGCDAQSAQTAINALRESTDLASSHRQQFARKMCDRLNICDADGPYARIAQSAVANLIGSVTYFHGKQLVQTDDHGVEESAPHGLFTGVPSRSFFPRGFLWDEGFHQLIVSQWDAPFAVTAITSWLHTADETGWIAREQILGEEARSRVPEQFRVQRRDIANPPTLLMPTIALLRSSLCAGVQDIDVDAQGNIASNVIDVPKSFCNVKDAARPIKCLFACENAEKEATTAVLSMNDAARFLQDTLPILSKNYQWYKTSQAGKAPFTMRWRGATRSHNFASGFDDHPRGETPTDEDENVDLLAWMAMAANILAELHSVVGDSDAVASYRADFDGYLAQLDRYWNAKERAFCDIGATDVNATQPVTHVCHFGYVSLFPFLLRLLQPDDPRLELLITRMANPEELWSPYGLRSLSKQDVYYGQGEDYWRQAVWINMNYLAVSALQHYASVTSNPALSVRWNTLASELKNNILQNVAHQYQQTGFLWENYDSRTGVGRGTHPFTGWTALVALLAADKYPF